LPELGGYRSDPVPVRWIVFPSLVPGARTELLPMPKAEAVFRLASDFIQNAGVWRDRAALVARELVRDASVARLVVGSPDEAVTLLTGSLESMREGVVA
jgi:hypothetical protein